MFVTAVGTEAFLRLCPDPCAVLGPDDQILAHNDAWSQLFGDGLAPRVPELPPPATTKPALTQLPVEDTEGLLRAVAAARREESAAEPLHFESRTTGGGRSQSWLDFHLLRSRKLVLVLVKDLTTERALRLSNADGERRFYRMLDQTPLPVWLADADGQCTWCNRAYLDFADVDLDSQLGSGWMRLIHERDTSRCMDALEAGFRGREPFSVEFRMLRADGEHGHVLQVCHPRVDHDGLLEGFISVWIDNEVTHRAIAERERVMQRVMVNQKLESLGVLAGGVAHDLGNLLMAVLGNADVALAELDANEDPRGRIESIRNASQQAGELCRQLLTYSGRTQPITEAQDLSAVLSGFEGMLQMLLGRRANLHLELNKSLPPTECDAAQVRQVAMNLVRNSFEATAPKGDPPDDERDQPRITLRTGEVQLHGDELRGAIRHERTRAGHFVYLEVEDDGPGMTEEVAARIFEPFWSGGGTGHGLGLAAVRGIVRSHRGAITFQTGRGDGTRFRVHLPVASSHARGAPQPLEIPRQPVMPGRPGRALLIDDDEEVRRVSKAMLGLSGFTPEVAASGDEGLALLGKHDGQFDVVVLDLVMPDKDGLETFRELRKDYPNLPVLFASAATGRNRDAASLDDSGVRSDPNVRYLAKPFRIDTLARVLTELLGKAMPPAAIHASNDRLRATDPAGSQRRAPS